jgi:putative sterol carrier protein
VTDETSRFFSSLDRRGHEPLLEKASGTLRIDLHEGSHTDHWVLEIDKGNIAVSRDQRDADGVVGASPELFERLVRGEENAVAAMLRGDMTVSGNLQLILRVERLFPGPPDTRGPQHLFGRGGHQ